MRESSSEFASSHPKIAKRLGMHGIEVADPYVERLIEAFCFMSARMRIKLDAEFPRFTQRLLEVIYPNYVAPTPSMAVAQLHPSTGEGDFSKGFLVPKGTSFFAKVPEGEETACEFARVSPSRYGLSSSFQPNWQAYRPISPPLTATCRPRQRWQAACVCT
jgi:type VI secretion system protein ImpG